MSEKIFNRVNLMNFLPHIVLCIYRQISSCLFFYLNELLQLCGEFSVLYAINLRCILVIYTVMQQRNVVLSMKSFQSSNSFISR